MKKSNICISVLGTMFLVVSISTAQAAKSSDAYFVKVDRDTTTENSAGTDPKKKQPSGKDKGSGIASGKRQHKPIAVTKPIDKAATGNKNKVAPKTSAPAPLLLPAVQKVRESASKSKKKGKVEASFKVEEGQK